MEWKVLKDLQQIEDIIRESQERPQVIFKHSTRCSISSVAKNRLEKGRSPENIDFHFLDLIAFRQISNAIAERFQVHHESPQILIINNGECTYDESHMGISMQDIVENAGA
jgi:bacillithiol system protein YtxJ